MSAPRQHRSRPWWPAVPEPAASARCEECMWAWREGAMRIKVLNPLCPRHGRYAA